MPSNLSDGSVSNANAGSNPYSYTGADADGTTIVANDATVSNANPLPVAIISGGGGGGGGTSLAQAVTYFDVITAGTGYAVGDVLARLIEITPGTTDTLVARWVNITQNTELGSSPTMANLVEQNNNGALPTGVSQDTGGVGILGVLGGLLKRLSNLVFDGSSFLKVNIAAASNVPVTGTFYQATQPISAASLPLPSGAATAAKQPALGVAGTASTDVISVQGIASMTPLKMDGSAVTQPISATALPLPAGAATSAKQPALGTAGTPSSDVLTIQGASAGRPLITANGGGATPAVNAVAASTSVATALSANTARLGWIITNDTAVLMYVKLGTGASSSSYTYCLSPKSSTSAGGSCEGTQTCAITVILSSGTGNALVTEVTA